MKIFLLFALLCAVQVISTASQCTSKLGPAWKSLKDVVLIRNNRKYSFYSFQNYNLFYHEYLNSHLFDIAAKPINHMLDDYCYKNDKTSIKVKSQVQIAKRITFGYWRYNGKVPKEYENFTWTVTGTSVDMSLWTVVCNRNLKCIAGINPSH